MKVLSFSGGQALVSLCKLHTSATRFVLLSDVTGDEATLDAVGYKLMKAERTGGLDAFEQIVRSHEKQVFRLAYRILGNVADAQDVAQEVFIKLHRSLGTFDEARDFKPWLNRVTVNACTDALRRRKVPVALQDAVAATHELDPEHAMGLDERRHLLLRSLEQLPPKQRAAIVLRDIEGLSTTEVAEALGSTEATVRSHIACGRAKLKGILTGLLGRRS